MKNSEWGDGVAKKSGILWTVIGALIFCLVMIKTSDLFKVGHDRSYQALQGFYQEKKNSLDAVYIGGSSVHAFWEPPIGWNDHGIAVWSMGIDSLPNAAVKNLIADARKTQPDALYIININSFRYPKMDVNYVMIHRAADYMRFSKDKLNQINWLAEQAGIPKGDRLELLLPVIRFHSRWNELTDWDFSHTVNGLKKGLVYTPYFSRIENLTKSYHVTDKTDEPTKEQLDAILDLLDYCDREKVNALFVLAPQALPVKTCMQINTVENIIRERGYPCWDILKIADELGLQTDTDFYNAYHTNVHRSMKFIDYFGQKLVEEYGFTDKRGQAGWESWDRSVDLYTDVIGPYSLPLERSHEPRDYSLDAPIPAKPAAENGQIRLSWTASDGAEFYEIYRKSQEPGDESWKYLDAVDGDTDFYMDGDLAFGMDYTYTVVPGYVKDGVKYYGNFDYKGVTGKVR